MATGTDAAEFVPKSPKEKRKKSFYAEEEEIVVKPSTELIPDEYEHITKDTVLLHVFRTQLEEELAENLVETLEYIGYQVNLHYLDDEEEFFADLKSIKNQTLDKSALLLIFIGFYGKGGGENGSLLLLEQKKSIQMKQIWNFFSANECPELKNKPKIFIFCTSEEPGGIHTDSMKHVKMDFDKVYDFPAESDMLIVYNKVLGVMPPISKNKFLIQLSENIHAYSKKYDIIDLLSYINYNNTPVPLIVSTLTRKFYLTPSNEREHYLTIFQNQYELEESLKKIQDELRRLHEMQKKKKDNNFFKSFSFKKKSEDKPKVIKRQEAIAETQKSPRGSKNFSSPPVVVASRLSSTSSTVGGRTRLTSETDSGAVKKKPHWRF